MKIFKFNGEEITEPLVILIENPADAADLHAVISHDGAVGELFPGMLISAFDEIDPEAVKIAAGLIWERWGDPNYRPEPFECKP